MNTKSSALALLLAAGALVAGAPAYAQVDTMSFVGINQLNNTGALVENYYDGGISSVGTTGTNYGVSFGNDATAENSKNSKSNFLGNPSGNTAVLYFAYLSSTNSNFTAYNTMNDAAGFLSLSFNYASTGAYNDSGAGTPTVALYSGVNGTGTLLATIDLSVNNYTGDGCATGKICEWNASATNLTGGQVAESAVFSNASEYTYFDNVQITPVPEPSTIGLALAGVVAVGGIARLRRRC